VFHTKQCNDEEFSNVELLRSDISIATKLHTQLCRSQNKELNSSLPAVKESEKKSSHIMTECVKFRNAAQIWWEQPAQTLVPWVTEDNLNLSQYLDQFASHAATLKKMQLVS